MRRISVVLGSALALASAPTVAFGQSGDIDAKLGNNTTASFVVKDSNNQEILVLEANDQASQSPNVIGGHNANSVSWGAYGATIGGGGESAGMGNLVTDDYGTVGGGKGNQAGDGAGTTSDIAHATVGGGVSNTASGWDATVGGGDHNAASSSYSTIGGGMFNTVSGYGYAATVGGGGSNAAAGLYSTVPGGFSNSAGGDYSFAAGRWALANSSGCFVWGDSTGSYLTCSTPDRWLARTSGGVDFFTSSGLTTGVTLPAGGSAWGAVSDRAVKENFSPVDKRQVLEKVAAMPVEEWNLKTQDPSIRHIGPVAQDFNGTFGYGEEERYINMMDATGVTMAAVQGLYEVVRGQEQTIENQTTQIQARDRRIEELESKARRIDELEKRLEELTTLVRGAGAVE